MRRGSRHNRGPIVAPWTKRLTTAMDHSHAAPAPATETSDQPLFTAAEIREFDADDVEAGKNLCKMLSLFFFYTVIVMGLSTYITYSWVSG